MGLECYSLLVEWSINAVLVATFFSYLCFEAYSHKSFVCFSAQSVGIFLCQTQVCLGKTDSRPVFLASLVHLETCQSTFLLCQILHPAREAARERARRQFARSISGGGRKHLLVVCSIWLVCLSDKISEYNPSCCEVDW